MVTKMFFTPYFSRRSTLRSMIGLSPTFSSGFGVVKVSGRRRSPRPPAISTASIGRRAVMLSRSRISVSLPACVTGISRRCRRFPTATTSAGLSSSVRAVNLEFIASFTLSATFTPRSRARRMSPSVTAPRIIPSASVTKRIILPPDRALMASRASFTDASAGRICFLS